MIVPGTLTYTDTIRRVGYTTIDGVKVMQYDLTLPTSFPSEMRLVASKLNEELYKANRDICRADQAAFEDAAYCMQDEYISKQAETQQES